MHNLLFSEGGQPLHLDDLNFLQQAFTEPLLALASTWGNCIISGCEIRVDKETSITSATSGIIAFEGKLYRVSAHSLGQTEQSDEFFWLFSEREDGYKSFEDGNEHPTQRLCTAELLSTREAPSTGKYIADSELPRLGIDIAPKPRHFKTLKYTVLQAGDLVNFTELSPYSAMITLRFKITDLVDSTRPFAGINIKGVGYINGSWDIVRGADEKINISLENGLLTLTRKHPTSGTTPNVGFSKTTYATFLITWDYIILDTSGFMTSADEPPSGVRGSYGGGNRSRR